MIRLVGLSELGRGSVWGGVVGHLGHSEKVNLHPVLEMRIIFLKVSSGASGLSLVDFFFF